MLHTNEQYLLPYMEYVHVYPSQLVLTCECWFSLLVQFSMVWFLRVGLTYWMILQFPADWPAVQLPNIVFATVRYTRV